MEVKGYPKYLIYDDGRVFSKKSNRFLKPKIDKRVGKEYLRVGLYDVKQKFHSIHRLVAEHYILNPNNFKEVDHIDRDKNNNHISNLRWCNRLMNAQNQDNYKTNTSGHKGIFICESGSYRFRRRYNNKDYCSKTCKKLNEVLWFKFMINLTIKNGFLD